MTEDFNGRKALGDSAEQMTEAYFRSHHYDFSKTSSEAIYPASIRSQLVSLMAGNPAVRYVIHCPDYSVIQNGKRCWVEVKSTDAIARSSYEHYLELDQLEPVYIFFCRSGYDLFAVRVCDLVWCEPDWRSPNRPDADSWHKVDFSKSAGRSLKPAG